MMPWYLFSVFSPDGSSREAGSTNLPDDDAARRYGHLIVRELIPSLVGQNPYAQSRNPMDMIRQG
jgi:hypothetical protein